MHVNKFLTSKATLIFKKNNNNKLSKFLLKHNISKSITENKNIYNNNNNNNNSNNNNIKIQEDCMQPEEIFNLFSIESKNEYLKGKYILII